MQCESLCFLNFHLHFQTFSQVGFAAADAVTGLKLVEAGVKKETLALMAVPLVPLQILLPLIISKFTTGKSYFLSLPTVRFSYFAHAFAHNSYHV